MLGLGPPPRPRRSGPCEPEAWAFRIKLPAWAAGPELRGSLSRGCSLKAQIITGSLREYSPSHSYLCLKGRASGSDLMYYLVTNHSSHDNLIKTDKKGKLHPLFVHLRPRRGQSRAQASW